MASGVEAKSRELSPSEVRDLLSIERKDVTMEYLRSLFACFMGNDKAQFNTYDTFTLPAGRLYNKETIKTTIGRYIFNLVVLPVQYLQKYGYVNYTLAKNTLGGIEEKLGNMLLNDEISTKDYGEYLDNGEWLGMGTAYFLVPSLNYEINVPIPEVIERRDELFEKYKKEIREGKSEVADLIEKELLELAEKKIKEKNNDAYDFYSSKVGSFSNNYKKSSIMAGAVENPYTKKLDILRSNYTDGIEKDEYSKFANLTIIGGYSRGVETQVSRL